MVEDVELVCGNSDYRVIFEFDEDWAKYNAKTALFVFGDTTVEVPFFGNVIEPEDAVAIERATKCYVGVYTGDLITTTKAEIKCLPSIRDIAKKASPPKEDVYLRLIKLLNDIKLGGSAIIEVDELPQYDDEINSNILYRTSEGLFYYNGLWEKLIDESDIESIRHDLDVVESLAKGAHQAVSFGNYETMVTALNALPKDTYKIPQSIMIVTLNVPDLWVSAIAEKSVPYTYVDDTTLANEIFTNGSVQVGYYVLSALETQKVDLTNYVKNTDMASWGTAGVIKLGDAMTISNGKLYFFTPSDADFKKSTRPVDHLKVSNTDQIVKYGLTDCRIAWTNDTKDESGAVVKGDKTKARELIGAVGVTDYANEGKAGVVMTKQADGFRVVNGYLNNPYALENDFKNKKESHFLRPKHYPLIGKYGVAYNTITLTDEEKASAQKWLGVSYDSLPDKPFYDTGISMQLVDLGYGVSVGLNVSDSYNNYCDAYLVSTDTYSANDLIGAVVTSVFGVEFTIGSSHIKEETDDGIWIAMTNDAYSPISIFVAYNSNYQPTIVKSPFPQAGVYFTSGSNDYESFGVSKVEKQGEFKALDNKYLDLENNNTIKALIARIEALENK